MAAALAATLAVCSAHAARPDDRTPTERTIDSLFYAGRYDTLCRWIPSLVRAAEASGDSAYVGRLAFQRGRVEITLGHQALASRELDRAIRLTEAARDTVGLVPALHFKAFVLRDQGQVEPAMAHFQRELDLSRRAHLLAGEANAVFNLAFRDLRRGNLALARTGYLRAMELFRRTGDSYQVAIGTNALGNLYRALGDVDSSRYWFVETRRIARENGYPFHELWALNNLGLLEGDIGNYEASLECYKAAFAIGKRIGFDRGIALPAMNLALSYSYMGQRDLAFRSLDESIAVCRRAGFKDLEVNTTIVAGMLHLEAGRSNQAAGYFRAILGRDFVFESVRRNEAAYGLALAQADMDSVDQGLHTLEPFVSPRVRVEDHMEQAYFELAYVELLRRARRCDEALDRVSVLRDDLDRSGRTDLSVIARLMESACRREQGETSLAAGVLGQALDSLEVARSEVGRADLREAYGMHVMNELLEGCRVLLEYPPGAPRAGRVRSFFDALQRFKTRTLLERIRDPRGNAGPPASGALTHPITAGRLQKDVLHKGELLLDLVAGGDEAYMFAISPDSCRLVVLPGWRSGLADQMLLYADLLAAPSRTTRDSYTADRIAAMQRALGKTILGPVADLVAGADRVIVASGSFFAPVPFATLSPDGDRMLMEMKDVVEVPSASVLEWARAEAGGATKMASSIVAVGVSSGSGLAGARHEIRSLERRYAGVEPVNARPGVLDSLAARAHRGRILHVAAHARVNDESPWQSGFLLSEEAAVRDNAVRSSDPLVPAGEDVLRAAEIAQASLPYGIAVLAGCETAGGRATNGEGVLGLTSAFLSAGVPVIVSSRWPVDDRATAVLMEHFYDRLAEGETVAGALRAAQLKVRSDRRTSHPFYWAGFAVVGDGARVIQPVLAQNRRDTWLKAGAGAVLVAGLAGWMLRRRRVAAPATA